ncbi:MFS transporter [Kineococcus rhizosphaerae]|uniref:Putative MFS family arabinose efflux permease n=1 Tax=Kineococcus rhizosphaerae TaxID=559628 RepID=A0A2T0QUU9_9ACTN|nr:MFS transporter [Kineococcus rhizosphaerae]PRY08949.1 putative MFS family arabinose efflux permease [Kineococcus rhizosphaerae]
MANLEDAPTAPPVRRTLRVSRKETRLGTTLALLAWIFAVYDYIMFGTLLPEIRTEYGWSEGTATGIATAISVGTMVVVLGVGPLVDKIGRRRGMMVTVGGTALASGLTALTMNPAYLIGVRSIAGLGIAEQSVNATYLNEIYAATEDDKIKKNRGFAYAVVQSGWPIGVFLAAGFVALLLPLVGWRGVFALATLPAIALVLLRRKLKESPQFTIIEQARALEKQGDKVAADSLLNTYGLRHENGAPLRAIFAPMFRRNTILLSVVWFFNFFGVTTFTALGTTLLTSGKGIPFSLSLLVFMVANIGGFLGYLTFGAIGQRFGRRGAAGVGFIIACFFYTGMLLWAEGTVSIMVLYALGQFFMAGPFACLMFFMGESYSTDCRGTGTTFLNAIGQPGSIAAGAIITAMLVSGYDWTVTAMVVGVTGVFLSGVAMLCCKVMPQLDDFGAGHAAHGPVA